MISQIPQKTITKQKQWNEIIFSQKEDTDCQPKRISSFKQLEVEPNLNQNREAR